MKGPFSIWPFFGLTIWIDTFTHILRWNDESKIDPYKPIRSVSVMIPAHREQKDIVSSLKSIYRQRYPVKNVFVVGDKFSDATRSIIGSLSKRYGNLKYIESPFASKAMKVNYLVKNFNEKLGDFIYVMDARVVIEEESIERIISCFNKRKVAAVTSYGRVSIPKNFLSRSYHYGKAWVNEIGRFRKNAQEKRKAVFVICGASTIYRKNVLKRNPIPSCTKTEDTHYTWVLQRKGYKIRVADDAVASSPDIDGYGLQGITNQIKQSYRWSAGTMQCLVYESGNIMKNKKLFFSTIIPGFVESVTYSIVLVLSPFFLFFTPELVAGFFIGDTVFSIFGTLVITPSKFKKTVIHYPQILLFKYINALIFVIAFFVVNFGAIFGNPNNWSNEWTPLETTVEG